jgi:hypothetical protein
MAATRTSRLPFAVGLLTLLVFATASSAAPPPGKGGGDDADAAGELYGDLYVLERDGNGEPISYEFAYPDPEIPGLDVTVGCFQPLAGGCAPLLPDCAFIPLNVLKPDFDPEVEDACGPQAEFLDCLQEVGFGRGSVARSQAFVIDSAYAEVVKTVNEAEDLRRDPAGRLELLVTPEGDPDAEPDWKTIDAPLENLGLYREVMRNGCLGSVKDEVVGEGGVATEVTYALDESAIDLLCGGTYPTCSAGGFEGLLCDYPAFGELPDWWMYPTTPDSEGVTHSDMLLAGAFVAGATDKSDPLSLDEIVNVNTYLGINSYTWTKVKKDRVLEVTYFRFEDESGGWFRYTRGLDAFAPDTIAPLLAWGGSCFYEDPELLLFDSPDGVALGEVDLTVCRNGLPAIDGSLLLVCDSESDPTYDPGTGQLGCGGANWFAQLAEHARKTIWYLHNWAVPEIDY